WPATRRMSCRNRAAGPRDYQRRAEQRPERDRGEGEEGRATVPLRLFSFKAGHPQRALLWWFPRQYRSPDIGSYRLRRPPGEQPLVQKWFVRIADSERTASISHSALARGRHRQHRRTSRSPTRAIRLAETSANSK